MFLKIATIDTTLYSNRPMINFVERLMIRVMVLVMLVVLYLCKTFYTKGHHQSSLP